MQKSDEVEWIDCPYMPDGWVAMRDAVGIAALNVTDGYMIRMPPIEFTFKMPTTFSLKGDMLTGYIEAGWRFRNA